ncbi:hypothetical protein Zmor_020436 [Zophobas morio]|uniref:Gustatory receptor n=1 Tax=Zophobas morio TaxID=2755281 RepID=A0AA38I3L0_9CUCU|nr:hypothetical protein Zmor_020436 [Zophobas morio]
MSLIENTNVILKYFYKLLGIIQFTTDEDPSTISTVFSHIYPIPTFAYFFYASTIYMLKNDGTVSTYTSTCVEKIGGYSSLLTMLTSAVMFFKRTEQLKICLLKLDSIQIYFAPNKPPRKKKWVCGIMLAILSLNALFFFWHNGDLYEFGFYFIPMIMSAYDHVFLNDILTCVSCKFDTINRCLQRQVNSVDLFTIFPLNRVEEVRSMKHNEISSTIQRIQELTQMHYALINLTIRISGLFETTTIMAMLMWFSYVIGTVYYLAILLLQKTQEMYIELLGACIYLAFYFYWFFVMVVSFSYTQKKANETATYVHDIWNKYAMNNEVDKRVRHLQFVSLRLLNTRIQFTAKDFFNLDWTFCHMMIAAIGTYLVILIQFNNP